MRGIVLNRALWVLPLALWSLLLSTSLYWSLQQQEQHLTELAADRGRFVFTLVQVFRLWNAQHGGVYTLVTERNKPNKYLEHERRDIVTGDGTQYTMVNPAFMTRQLSGVLTQETGITLNITSLDPINPINEPLPWEREALLRFELQDAGTEWYDFNLNNSNELRYIGALPVKRQCLKCHEDQGYREGDIRGAISVSFSTSELAKGQSGLRKNIIASHMVIWLLLCSATLYGLTMLRRQLMALFDSKQSLESRTRELVVEMRDRRQSEAQLRMLIESSAEAILFVDRGWNIQLCNPMAVKLLGYSSADEILGKRAHELLTHGEATMVNPSAQCGIYRAIEEERIVHSDDQNFYRADGTTFSVEYRASPLVDNAEVLGAVVTFADISFRKVEESRQWKQANYDPLTGIVNRNLFDERLQRYIISAERYSHNFAMLFIDLDGFKEVNDQYGHEAGDYLLKTVADRLISCIRSADTVARIGGDEFTVILSEVRSREIVETVANKILTKLSGAIEVKGSKIHISASIGVAIFPDDGANQEQLIGNSDRAMYYAKGEGKNRTCFVSDLVDS